MGRIILNKKRCFLCNEERIHMHKFPSDSNRFLLWLKNLQREDLLYTLSKQYICNNARICALHFKDEAFTSTLKIKLLKHAAPYPVNERNQVLLNKALDCNSGKADCKTVEKTNLSSPGIIEKSSVTVASSSNTNERLSKTDKIMTKLSRPGLVEDSLVTIISLCCTDKKEGIAFHKFLQDPEQRMHWISAVKQKNHKPSHISVLCPKHFSTDKVDCDTAFKVRLKENAEPNTFPSNDLNCQKDTGFFQKWKEVNPVNHKDTTTKDEIFKSHNDPKVITKIYVKVKWDESVSKIAKTVHSLQAGTISTNLPKPQTTKRQLVNHAVTKKKIIKSAVEFSKDTRSESVVYMSDNSRVTEIDLVNSLSSAETKRRKLNHSSIETESEGGIKPVNIANYMKKVGIDSDHNYHDTEVERRQRMIEDISHRNTRSFEVPNEWWGITRTPQYIIFSKWNEFYDTIFRVIIENSNVKIFIKGRECVNENRKVSFENISALLHEVDSYKICAGIDDKAMTSCIGRLDVSQEQFSVWCKSCQKKRKESMKIL